MMICIQFSEALVSFHYRKSIQMTSNFDAVKFFQFSKFSELTSKCKVSTPNCTQF